MEVHLAPETVKMVETLLRQRKRVEIGVKNEKVIVWELSSKTKHEQPTA